MLTSNMLLMVLIFILCGSWKWVVVDGLPAALYIFLRTISVLLTVEKSSIGTYNLVINHFLSNGT